MRLLQITESGFCLTEFMTDNIPPYAILSHTWGPPSDEVTYNDMQNGTAKTKPGYIKLEFCAAQAKRDGLRFFWVDTCCIDKSSQVELSRSIVSMFKWYQAAHRCYVYLADVSAGSSGEDHSQPQWKSAFRQSRWFTRGWTLQELLAPSSVEFFSNDGIRLGDKLSLSQQVHEVTGIHLPAITGDKIFDFSVEDRFKWSASRQTTESEDIVYCLLGIFDVSMSIIYGEGVEKAQQRLKQEIASKNSTPSFRQKKRQFMVAFERNPAFTGRDSELKRMRTMPAPAQRTARLAIAGLGGVGKTQLALEFVYQRQQEFTDCAVFWVPSVSQEMINQAFHDISRKIGLPTEGTTKTTMQESLRDYWSSEKSGRWILVFDNVDDIKIWEERGLVNCLPRNELGTIVFTTRNRQVATRLAGTEVIDLSKMTEASSRQLLHNYLISKELLSCTEDTNALVKQLAYLPLALVQAATYINMNGLTIREYTELFNEQELGMVELLSEDFDDEWRYKGTLNPVSATWLISFTQIQDRNPAAAEYLSLMACFDSKDIPRSLLPKRRSRKEEVDAIGTLTAYSFIHRQAHDDLFTMHPLVHVATRNWLRQEGTLGSWTEQAVAILEKALSGMEDKDPALWRPCLPHAYYQIQASGDDLASDSSFDLKTNYTRSLHFVGRLDQAGDMLVQVIIKLKATKGVDDARTLICMNYLAGVRMTQNRRSEGEALYEEISMICSARYGPKHPYTLNSVADLADAYIGGGKISEAEASLVQTLEICKKVLGPDNAITLKCLENQSKVYQKQGKQHEVEGLLVQLLEDHNRVSGPNSFDAVSAMKNLGEFYYRQNRLDEAEEAQLRALENCTESLGHGHMLALLLMKDLADTYIDQGRLKDAEEIALRGREIAERTSGANNYTAAMFCPALAHTLKKQDRLVEAVVIMREGLRIYVQTVGPQHSATAHCRVELEEWEEELRSRSESS